MHILDEEADKPVRRIQILLTPSEAGELRDSLNALLASPDTARHEHVSNDDFSKEITIAVWEERTLPLLADRIRCLIQFDR
jgi:hypothetical protein